MKRRVLWRCRDCGCEEMRPPWEARRYERCRPCAAVYLGAQLRERRPPHLTDPVAWERWLKGQQAPERRERMRELMTGREQVTELTRRGSPRHFRALHITVRSPAGVPYRVDNVAAFVRGHPELFSPEDVVSRDPRPGWYRSRAAAGLRRLQSASGTAGSWKGWTLTFGCQDELGRRPLAAGDAGAETINQGATDEDAN